MDQAFINLSIGLLILIASNIVLGSVGAIFEKKFDVGLFFKGIGKAVIIAITMAGIYIAGALNPDIIAVDIAGQQLTVLSAISAVVLGGYFFYAAQVFEKLATLLKAKKPDEKLED